ncbi:MAG: GntR family transcriptional regulator, partial [Actinomycetota bacterium]
MADELRASIRQGDYQPGNLIPKETELMRRFSASRTTVRRAI